jgi:outer membrane protein assembly factor BamB
VSNDDLLRLPIEQAWIYNASAGFSAGSPLIVDDLVFVGTRKGEVHVIELDTGDRVGTQEFGHSIEGTPALLDEMLYVPNAWGGNALVAFDLLRGTEVWKHRGVPIESSLLISDDLLIAGDVEGNVIGFNRTDGRIAWVYEFGEIAAILTGPTAIDVEHVVVANEDGKVVAIRVEDGSGIWTRNLDGAVEASIAVHDQRIFVPTTRGAFHALDANSGETIWTYQVPENSVRFAGSAVSNGLVVFGGSDGLLRGLDAEDGSTQWTFSTDGTFSAAPAVSGDLVFVGAMDRDFFAVSLQDGSLQWSTTLRGRIKSAPAVQKGLVIVMSEPKYVYAFANADAVASM